MYAWGSAEDDNLKPAVQTITGMHSSPGGVPGDTGGQAAQAAAVSPVVPALIGLGLLGIVVSGAAMARVRVPVDRWRIGESDKAAGFGWPSLSLR